MHNAPHVLDMLDMLDMLDDLTCGADDVHDPNGGALPTAPPRAVVRLRSRVP
jgi:hypothetical protein